MGFSEEKNHFQGKKENQFWKCLNTKIDYKVTLNDFFPWILFKLIVIIYSTVLPINTKYLLYVSQAVWQMLGVR